MVMEFHNEKLLDVIIYYLRILEVIIYNDLLLYNVSIYAYINLSRRNYALVYLKGLSQ
jgi:hypothetical protein